MKTICLDIGQVIVHLKFDDFLSEFAYHMNDSGHASFTQKDAWDFLGQTQTAHDLGFTLLENEIKTHLSLHKLLDKHRNIRIQRIIQEWNKTVQPNPVMIEWIEGLLDEGVKVALLSNIGHEHAKLMPTVLGSKVYNDSVRFFSCEVGARKPSILYYHTFLSLYPEYKGCVYMDDNLENIERGKKFGFQAVEFNLEKLKTTENVTNRLKEIKALVYTDLEERLSS